METNLSAGEEANERAQRDREALAREDALRAIDDRKAVDTKVDDRKHDDSHRVADMKSVDRKLDDANRVADHRADFAADALNRQLDDRKADDRKAEDRKAADRRADDQKAHGSSASEDVAQEREHREPNLHRNDVQMTLPIAEEAASREASMEPSIEKEAAIGSVPRPVRRPDEDKSLWAPASQGAADVEQQSSEVVASHERATAAAEKSATLEAFMQRMEARNAAFGKAGEAAGMTGPSDATAKRAAGYSVALEQSREQRRSAEEKDEGESRASAMSLGERPGRTL